MIFGERLITKNMYRVSIHKSIIEIEKTVWNKLAHNNIFMSYEWLKTFECSSALPLDSYYIMIFERENLIGSSVCYFEKRKENLRHLDPVLLGRIIHFKWTRHLSFLPAVICNPKRGFGTHFLISKELNQEEINSLQNKLLDTIEEIGAAKKASICFYNVMDTEINLMQLLTDRGYSKTLGMPLNHINVRWSSFDEYRRQLRQKHPGTRKTISREINKNRKSGVVINQLQNINNTNKRLFELLKMNHNKYDKTLFPLKPNYFHQLKENFGDNAVIFTAVKKGIIIGVSVKLRKDGESVFANIGIDHEGSGNDCTYFILAFYEPIKNAITNAPQRLYSGNALYKTKAKRGFTASNTYIFYKSKDSMKKFFVRIWFLIHRLWMIRKFSFIKHL